MKILIISDIHGYSENLSLLETKIDMNSFTNIVLLGDIFSDYHTTLDDRDKIINFMNKYKNKLIVVRGNCDTEEDINDIPVKVDDVKYFKIDKMDFYFTHGNKYRYLKNDTFTDGVLIYGHEHIPYIKKKSDMIYINTGSISLPRNELGKSFAIYEDKKVTLYNLDNLSIIDSINLRSS